MYNIEKIKNYLKKNLSDYRYNHCLMVADEAKKLAIKYNVDFEKAYVAGLVHDIAKELSLEENLEYINKYNLSKDLLDENLRPVIHADIGAVLVKELFGFDDEICNSVKYHAIGNFPMTTFEKIIYVADKIARENPDDLLLEIQKLAYEDLDMALLKCLEFSKTHLEKAGKTLHPATLKLLEALRKRG